MNLDCSNCHSENTQKLSLIVNNGTMDNKSQTAGLGFAGSGLGLGVAASKGTSTSKLAKQYAEPEKMPVIGGFFAIMMLSLIATIFFGSIAIEVGVYIGIAVSALSLLNNLKSYPKQYASWDAKFICLKCSTVFTPKDNHTTNAEDEA